MGHRKGGRTITKYTANVPDAFADDKLFDQIKASKDKDASPPENTEGQAQTTEIEKPSFTKEK